MTHEEALADFTKSVALMTHEEKLAEFTKSVALMTHEEKLVEKEKLLKTIAQLKLEIENHDHQLVV